MRLGFWLAVLSIVIILSPFLVAGVVVDLAAGFWQDLKITADAARALYGIVRGF